VAAGFVELGVIVLCARLRIVGSSDRLPMLTHRSP
jgi:hypothetical protein